MKFKSFCFWVETLPHSISLENLWQIHQLEMPCIWMWCDVFVANHRVEDNVLSVKLSTHVGNLLKMLYNSHTWKLRTSLCIINIFWTYIRVERNNVHIQECYFFFYFRVSFIIFNGWQSCRFVWCQHHLMYNHILKLKEKLN